MEYVLPHLKAALATQWHRPPIAVVQLLQQIPVVDANCSIQDPPGITILEKMLNDDELPTWQTMCRVQAEILKAPVGSPVGFRKGKAYARGREREYIFFDGLESLFERKVEQDMCEDTHPFVKAARLYLDIIFVHPFDDGNARAAAWWFYYHTKRVGLRHPDFDAIRRLPKHADSFAYWDFVRWAALNTISHADSNSHHSKGNQPYATAKP